MAAILVPFTPREWQIVKGLFQKHGDDLIPAFDILTMWRSRLGNITPVIFHITEHLLHVDRLWHNTDFKDDYAVKTLSNNYGLSIIRVINYINEICQKLPGTTTIASAVANMDIPEWIVDLRHKAAHNHMPSIEMLKNAAEYLREWVWDKYWSQPFENAIKWAIPKKVFDEQLMQNRIEIQKASAFEIIRKFVQWRNKNPTALHQPTELMKIPEIIEINEYVTKHPDVIISMLAEDALISSTGRLEKGGFSITYNEDGIWEIPNELQTYWAPLITLLHEKNHIMKLVLVCIKCMHESTTPYEEKKQLAGWVDLFLEMLVLILNKKDKSIHNQDLSQWRHVVKCILSQINNFRTERIGQVLEATKIFPEKRTKQLVNILKLRARDSKVCKIGSSDDSAHERLNIADRNLKHLGNEMINALPKAADVNEGMEWSLADTDFTDCPLGLMPIQSSESLYLFID